MIGEETSRRLDVIPAQVRAIVTHAPKYACRACTDGVIQAAAPERLIKGGLSGPRRCSPMCWSPTTLGTCRYIGRRRYYWRRVST
ncbi:IS66 family transposase zinc-finger binding domain-containing protein [Bradyrhizobium sp. 186]|uniref:IS66 family transposase zinc-finger binding domain-containing protein n=1 Tax=Bradyrhizobium sp. 186 TaxID=2782654 RepID=UPI0020009FAD